MLTQDYAYDRTQQLIGWDNDLGGSVQSKSYAYDAVGNRLQTIESGITDIYSYGNIQHPNQLTQVANASRVMSFLYDQNGSQRQKVTKPVAFPNDSIVESFSWSYASRLLNYSTSSFENSVETNEQWEYTYGPHGERQSKRRTGRSTGFQLETTHPWVYYGITGAQQLSTWHGRQTLNDSCYLGQHVWMYPQEYIAYGAGSVHAIELTPSNNKRYKFTDHLGTTWLVVNDRNALVTQRDTKPFGGELFLFGVDTRKGFIDKETDSESGLGDFSARKYDNKLGLFTRPDIYWEMYRGISPYAYSTNSPLTLMDPSGDTIAVYDGDGNFTGYEDLENSGITGEVRVNDSYSLSFEFHNIDQDRSKIENGIVLFSHRELREMVESATESLMETTSLFSIFAQSFPAPDENDDGWSDANHKTFGLLDFSPELRDKLRVEKVEKLALVLPAASGASSSSRPLAYDRFELGNFLWGAAGSRMEKDLGILLTGAQLNNVFNGRRDNPQLENVGLLDDPFDQNAIVRGYEYFYWRAYEND